MMPASTRHIRLVGVQADCAEVRLDGAVCGWCWGPEWSVRLPAPIASGRHVLEVRVVPSTFNFYGTHHQVDGDIAVVSPA
jgi:hypothetical protein